jgi:Tol biopolymer transport system component/formylglycine-generating enzyme required for sulfatase activity
MLLLVLIASMTGCGGLLGMHAGTPTPEPTFTPQPPQFGDFRGTLSGHSGAINSIAFSLDGQLMASGSDDNTIRIWRTHDAMLLHTLEGHTDTVMSIAFHTNEAAEPILASLSSDGTLRLWNAQDGRQMYKADLMNMFHRAVAFHPSGDMIAVGDQGEIDLLRTNDAARSDDLALPGIEMVWSIDFSTHPNDDSTLLAVANSRSNVPVFVDRGVGFERYRELEGPGGDAVRTVDISPNGATIATGWREGSVRLWSIDGSLLLELDGHRGDITSVAFSPDGRMVASGSEDGTVRVWNSDDGTQMLRLEPGRYVTSVAFSPDGKRLAAGAGSAVHFWHIYGGDSAMMATATPPPLPTATPEPPPLPDWAPELMEVPGGSFLMGSAENTRFPEHEKPQHAVDLPTYWIGKTEVTNAQFRLFVEGDGYSNPDYWTEDGWQWLERKEVTQPRYWEDSAVNGDEQPVVGVNWHEAVAYTQWLKAQTGHEFRLPTEAEWEKAARGTDAYVWPWGNTWFDDHANTQEAGLETTLPVGSIPEGTSPYGALDMAGNVEEWCATQGPALTMASESYHSEYPYQLQDEWAELYLDVDQPGGNQRMLRGGSRAFTGEFARTAARSRESVTTANNRIGFRVVSHSSPGRSWAEQEPEATTVIAPPEPLMDLPGMVAFASERDGNVDIYVMNADGSGSQRLTTNEGDDLQPAWSPDGSRIAFVSERDGNADIYVMNADGSDPQRLTTSESEDSGPAWSPDGSRIAFTSEQDGNADIHVMDADGSDPQRLTTSESEDSAPTWSPDGARIAFVSERDGNADIHVMNADGSDPQRLTTNESDDQQPAWSPDGSRIAFASDRYGDSDIYIMDSNGQDQRWLMQDYARNTNPTWVPESRYIAFVSDRDGTHEIYVTDSNDYEPHRITFNETDDWDPAWFVPPVTLPGKIAFTSERDGDWDIYVVNTDGSDVQNFTTHEAESPLSPVQDWLDISPVWSPDGARIAFTSDRDIGWEIYVMNADGTNLQRLTDNDRGEYDPSWSPDGMRIIYGSDTFGTQIIYAMNADGSNVQQLTTTENTSTQSYWSPTLSPDGTRIAFVSGVNMISEIYVMNVDGTNLQRLTDNDITDQDPAWSPDGTRIAFMSWRDGDNEIYVMNADGTDVQQITANETYESQPAWSPDGRHIAFVSDRDGNDEIYIMNADGTGQRRITHNEADDQQPAWSPTP